MKRIFLSATMMLCVGGLAPSIAWAATYDWTLTGTFSGSGQLTVGSPYTVSYSVTAGPLAGQSISTTGYDILSLTGTINGQPVTLLGGQPGFLPGPPNPGTPVGVSGAPEFSPFGLSYDNILYAGKDSLLIPCDLNPSLTNQYLDAYGVLLSYNGDEAEIWGNGPFGPPGDYYTFATRDSASYGEGEYLASDNLEGFVVSVPEPSTWVMGLLGFAGLGVVALRRGKGRSGAALA